MNQDRAAAAAEIVQTLVEDFGSSSPPADVRAALERIAQEMHARAKDDFIIKSWGRPDTAGQEWPKSKKFEQTGRMMVDSGRLLRSLSWRVTTGAIELFFDKSIADYAEFALKHRPAWGDEAPEAWMEFLESLLIREFKVILAGRLR